jgi:hypothetical protein
MHVQKRLIFDNLKEIYSQFKSECPKKKNGSSRICELIPKHCILATASRTHYACVCTIHQNVKLMANGVKLKDLTRDTNLELDVSTHSHCLALMICNPVFSIITLHVQEDLCEGHYRKC